MDPAPTNPTPIRPDPRGIASHVRALDPTKLTEETIRHGNIELVRRMAPGTWMYAILTALLAIWTSMALDHPNVLIIVGVSQVLIAIGRMILSRRYPDLYRRNPGRARVLFDFFVLSAGATWGAFVAFTIGTYTSTWTPLLVMLCTAGIMAGGTTALCLRRKLHTSWLVLIGAPLICVSFTLSDGRGVPFAGMAVLYLLFLMREARYLNRSFWRSLQKSQLIDEEHERRRRFLASVTHEIRTPMTCVLGLLQLVRDDPRHPANEERLGTIDRSARELLRLVNELLEAPTVDEPRAEIVCAPFNLPSCIDEVVRLVHPTAANKGLPVVVEHSDATPDLVVADRGRVRQVLLNIVHNAVRFTESGRIEVRSRLGTGVGGGSWIEITVEDTGDGMSPDLVRYALGDSERYGDDAGRMGLRISSYLMRRMGGTLCIQSGESEGTRVVLALPYVEAVGTPRAESTKRVDRPQTEAPKALEVPAVPVDDESPHERTIEVAAQTDTRTSVEPTLLREPGTRSPSARPGHVILVGGEERETRRMQAALELGGHHVSWVMDQAQVTRLLTAHPARAHAVLFLTPEEPRGAGEVASALRRSIGSEIGHVAMLATAWDPDEALSDSIGFSLDDIVSRDPTKADVALEVATAMDRRRLRSGGRAGILVGRMFM